MQDDGRVAPPLGQPVRRTKPARFSATPLAEAAQRIGRYRCQPVHMAPEVSALPVSGEVRIAQADEWLRLLPRLAPVQVCPGPDGSLYLGPR